MLSQNTDFTARETPDLIANAKNRRRQKADPRNAKFIAKNRRTLAKITAELRRKYGTANKRACKDFFV